MRDKGYREPLDPVDLRLRFMRRRRRHWIELTVWQLGGSKLRVIERPMRVLRVVRYGEFFRYAA
jgi:hypothetical protein